MLLAAVAGCEVGDGSVGQYSGKAPLPIDRGGTWINTDGPLTLEGLKGNVVWLEFSFLR